MKKKKTELQILQDDLNTMNDQGILKNPSESLLQSLDERIKNTLRRVYNTLTNRNSLLLTKRLKAAYNRHFNDLVSTHKGLKQYTLETLNPKLLDIYKNRVNSNLLIIKSQNEENMTKLQHKFLGWINLQSTGGSKETLKQATKLIPNKRLKFLIKDQSNKLTSAMDETIADYYGWIALQWKTRNDNRVVGKPGGLYPKVNKRSETHGDHWSRKDKFYYKADLKEDIKKKLNLSKFAGDTNFSDGMPGKPIGCRCYSVFYYEIEDLPKELVK